MKSQKTISQLVIKMMAMLMLGWFLFANYGIHFTTLHSHHEEGGGKEHSHKHHKEHDCLICDFQLAFYDPLQQTSFNINNKLSDNLFCIDPFYQDSFKLTEVHYTLSLRGPPSR